MRAVAPKRPRGNTAETVRSKYFPCLGGEDLISGSLSINPGALAFSLNYEPGIQQGYRRIDGIERLDGRPKPSAASYWVLNYDGGTQDFAVGNICTGAGGAVGEVLVVVLSSGTWGGGTAAGYLVLFNVTGTFVDNEAITGTGAAAVVNGTATSRGASNDTDDATWLHAAIVATRADITTVTGSGVTYPWLYAGVKYAFRNNAGGTACEMWKSSASGWTAVDLGKKLAFTSGGTVVIAEADTITGATSSATAVVKRVVVTSGTWAGGDAAGYVIFWTQTGAFQAENLNIGAAMNVATIAGNSAAQTLSPSGHYEFTNENFAGSTATRRMYGCDGVNKAFEFDGTTYCPITTGMTVDTPIHIREHKKHLFLSFQYGAVQHSSPGFPLTWSVVTGAAQIATGDEITGFEGVTGGILAIFNRNQTYLLYGTTVANWELRLHAPDSGAIEWSIQSIGSPRYLDDRGMTTLEAVQAYGDFLGSTFSQKIQPLIDTKLKAGTTVTASVRVRSKDQYRIFFSDGTGIRAKMRGVSPNATVEFTRVNYGITIKSACSVEDTAGLEVLLCAGTDGYVYQMDSGTSFDGTAIEAYLRLPFGHFGSPQQIKAFFKAVLEMSAPGAVSLEFTVEYDYGNSDNPRGITLTLDVDAGGGYWGLSTWSAFVWGAQAVGTAEGYLDGSGTNIGMFIRSSSIYESPHTINGVNLHYAMRGRAR